MNARHSIDTLYDAAWATRYEIREIQRSLVLGSPTAGRALKSARERLRRLEEIIAAKETAAAKRKNKIARIR